MKVEIIPEQIIWEYVSQRLLGKDEGGFTHRRYFSYLPDTVEISEEFLGLWKKNVGVAVKRALVETFGLKPFLTLERDQGRWISVTDQPFWQDLLLAFSKRAIDRIWDHLLSLSREIEINWGIATPADALLLCILDEKRLERYSFQWLFKNSAHWVIPAYVLEKRSFHNPDNLPWHVYFENPLETPLPLRLILIEATARFFEAGAQGVLRFIEDRLHGTSSYSKSIRPGVRFSFKDRGELLQCLENQFSRH